MRTDTRTPREKDEEAEKRSSQHCEPLGATTRMFPTGQPPREHPAAPGPHTWRAGPHLPGRPAGPALVVPYAEQLNSAPAARPADPGALGPRSRRVPSRGQRPGPHRSAASPSRDQIPGDRVSVKTIPREPSGSSVSSRGWGSRGCPGLVGKVTYRINGCPLAAPGGSRLRWTRSPMFPSLGPGDRGGGQPAPPAAQLRSGSAARATTHRVAATPPQPRPGWGGAGPGDRRGTSSPGGLGPEAGPGENTSVCPSA